MPIDNPSINEGSEGQSEYIPSVKVERTLAELEGELARRNAEAERGRTGPDESGKIHALEKQIASKKAETTPMKNETGAYNKPTPPPGSMLDRIQKMRQSKSEGLAHEA